MEEQNYDSLLESNYCKGEIFIDGYRDIQCIIGQDPNKLDKSYKKLLEKYILCDDMMHTHDMYISSRGCIQGDTREYNIQNYRRFLPSIIWQVS